MLDSPETGERLGQFVGIAENHGDALTYWILTQDDKTTGSLGGLNRPPALTPTNGPSTSTESQGECGVRVNGGHWT